MFVAAPGANSVSMLADGALTDPVATGLTSPEGLAVDGSGTLFVADAGAGRVVRVAAGGTQTVVADGLSAPTGVATDSSGDVFVAASGSGQILRLTAGDPHEVAAGFLHPVAVAVAPSGHLVVADAAANAVVDLDPDGTRTPVGGDLADPRGVAVDSAGTVYIADTRNDRVVAVAANGVQGNVGFGLSGPSAVAVGGDGTVYIADTGNGRVVTVAPDGTQTDIADATVAALAVYLAGQSITFTSSVPDHAAVGGTYVAAATGGASDQPVVFSSTSPGCTVSATGAVSFTAVGTCLIAADQAGSVGYARAPRTEQSIEVVRGSQTVAFTSSVPSGAAVGGTYTVVALGGGSGQAVVFSADTTSTACAVDATGTVTSTHTGSCVLDADQDGDANWEPAPTAQQAFTVAPGTQSIAFTSGVPDAAVVGGSYVPSAAGGASTQPVTLAVDPASAGCEIGTDGVTHFVHAGTCTVLADQAGDDDWMAADQVAQVITVGRQSGTVAFATDPPAAPVVGQTYVAIAASPAGAVTYSADGTSTGCTVATDGTVTLTAVGTCVIAAAQSGDSDTQPSTVTQSFAIGRGPQVVTFTSGKPLSAGVGATYVATATGGASGQPVVFSADPSGSACTVAAHGTVLFNDVGTCVVDADQSGTADYDSAARTQQSFAVGKGAQAITFTSTVPAAPVVGGTYLVTATGGNSGKPVLFTQTAISRSYCTVAATGLVRFAAVGPCTVIASQATSPRYFAAPKVQQSMVARIGQQVVFVSTATWPAVVGDRYTPIARGGASGKPVQIAVPTSAQSVCRIASGVVTFRAVGNCILLATQAGSTTYVPGTTRQVVPVFATGTAHSPIRHVVLLYQENHSFDETLGSYCATRATPCDGYVGPVHLKSGAVVPMTHSPDIVPIVNHNIAGQTAAMDDGAMDGWATVYGCTPPNYNCLTYYNPADIPNLTSLADRFAVSDRTFSLADSPSWGGHLYAAAATLDGFTGDNPHPVANLPAGPGWGCDSNSVTNWVAPDGTTSSQPSCVPAADGSGPFMPSPVAHVSTIFNLLDAQRLPWKIYGATKSGAVNGAIGGYGWSICPTFADCLYTQQVNNLVPSANILDDAATGTLPAYSVVTPSPSSHKVIGTDTSQHNQDSMIGGDDWIGRVVSAIENGPEWASTAVFITYDDCGCFYDHVTPPINPDGTRQGIRLPMVIVSPYAKPDYTDSNNASLASVLAFTERTLGLPAMSVNDASAYDYSDSFSYDQAPQAGAPLHQVPVPKASIAYAMAHPDDEDPT